MSFEDLIREIEANEQWLSTLEVEVRPPEGALDRVRDRISLEINEGWLADQAAVEPPPGVLAAVKRAVAEELDAGEPARAATPASELHRIYRLVSPLSAVAALVMAAGLGFLSAFPDAEQPGAAEPGEELAAVTEWDADEEEAEWEALEAEMSALESAFAGGSTSSWASGMLDDLDDDIAVFGQDSSLWPSDTTDEG